MQSKDALMPFKASIAANAVQEQIGGAKQLGAPYSPRTRFSTISKPGQIIRHMVRRGADDCFQALAHRALPWEVSVVVREDELAQRLHITARTVRTYIRLLEGEGLISTKREWQYNPLWTYPKLINRYTFHDHAVIRKYMGDDREKPDINKVAEQPRLAPTPIRPPAAQPTINILQSDKNPVAEPLPKVASPPIANGMAMLCWFSREMQTMMFLFYPADLATPVPQTAVKTPRSTPAKTRNRNPVPESNPYYQAVRTVANTTYFRATDPTAYEDVAAEFARLEVTPEIAGLIAADIVRSAGYQFRMIEDLYHLHRANTPREAPVPDKPIEVEAIECDTCGDTGVTGSPTGAVFCSCSAGRERITNGWVDEYNDRNFTEYWKAVFRRSNVNIERKPPERETGHVALQSVGGGTP